MCLNFDLKFGTSGFRSKMGSKSHEINENTLSIATQGICNYLKKIYPEGGLIIVSYDSRTNSSLFARLVTNIFAANNFHVNLVGGPRPTPFLSFLVRKQKALYGVNITASHNTKEYNGYKIYNQHGGQIVDTDPLLKEILSVKSITSEESSKRVTTVSVDLENEYIKTILSQLPCKEYNQSFGKNLKIVYTPLHGCGITMAPQAFEKAGFTNLSVVEKQSTLDGNFPTVKSPNPENLSSLKLGVEQLKRTQGDILISNDADADRVACAQQTNNTIRHFTGNEMGALLLYHLIKNKKQKEFTVITTHVTSTIVKSITEQEGGKYVEVLPGFKHISERIDNSFLFGLEESMGYLYGNQSYDKDGISSGLLIAETALQCKKENKSLVDMLFEIYKKYGIHVGSQISISCNYKMRNLKQVFKSKIIKIEELKTENNKKMITYHLKDNGRYTIRQSGTENKLKIYGNKSAPYNPLEHPWETTKKLEKEIVDILNKISFLLTR